MAGDVIQKFNLGVGSHVSITCDAAGRFGGKGGLFCYISLFCYILYSLKQ